MDSITGNTYFFIDGERFMYNPKQQSTQIIPKKHSKNIKINTVNDLGLEIHKLYEEHSKVVFRKFNIKLPPPLHANWLKLFVLAENENIAFEVIWDSYGK